MSNFFELEKFFSLFTVFATMTGAAWAIFAAFRSGALKRLRLGSIEFEAADPEVVTRFRNAFETAGADRRSLPFEIEQLANYYAQVLGQAKISFWFSLVFASIGFVIIVLAAFVFQEAEIWATGLKLFAGLIVDGVAALFFVQSKQAQLSMAAFFEKLRSDRQFVEARAMCEEISSPEMRDKLKTVLVLHYSGLDSSSLVKELISPQSASPQQTSLSS